MRAAFFTLLALVLARFFPGLSAGAELTGAAEDLAGTVKRPLLPDDLLKSNSPLAR